MVATLSSLLAPAVVVMTTASAVGDDTFDNMVILSFQWSAKRKRALIHIFLYFFYTMQTLKLFLNYKSMFRKYTVCSWVVVPESWNSLHFLPWKSHSCPNN